MTANLEALGRRARKTLRRLDRAMPFPWTTAVRTMQVGTGEVVTGASIRASVGGEFAVVVVENKPVADDIVIAVDTLREIVAALEAALAAQEARRG